MFQKGDCTFYFILFFIFLPFKKPELNVNRSVAILFGGRENFFSSKGKRGRKSLSTTAQLFAVFFKHKWHRACFIGASLDLMKTSEAAQLVSTELCMFHGIDTGPVKPLNYTAETLYCLDNGGDLSRMHKGPAYVCVCASQPSPWGSRLRQCPSPLHCV